MRTVRFDMCAPRPVLGVYQAWLQVDGRHERTACPPPSPQTNKGESQCVDFKRGLGLVRSAFCLYEWWPSAYKSWS